jgi:hypothetical protein
MEREREQQFEQMRLDNIEKFRSGNMLKDTDKRVNQAKNDRLKTGSYKHSMKDILPPFEIGR